jgi:transposase
VPDLAEGRRIAEQVLASFPSYPIPEIVRLGQTLRKWREPFLAYFATARASNGGTEAVIIWSPQRRVIDVAHGADRVRQRHVIWSMSTTSPTWLATGSRRVDIRSLRRSGPTSRWRC